MDMIPVSDLISLFLAFCGGISIIGAAAAYVAKAVGWLKRPEEKQNEILQDHEKRIARLEEKTDNYYSDIRKLQQEMKMMLRAVVAIMKHEIDGNNTADLKKEQEAIDDYLFEK